GEGEVRLLALDARRPTPPLELGVADDKKSGRGVVTADPALSRDEFKAKGEGGGKCPERLPKLPAADAAAATASNSAAVGAVAKSFSSARSPNCGWCCWCDDTDPDRDSGLDRDQLRVLDMLTRRDEEWLLCWNSRIGGVIITRRTWCPKRLSGYFIVANRRLSSGNIIVRQRSGLPADRHCRETCTTVFRSSLPKYKNISRNISVGSTWHADAVDEKEHTEADRLKWYDASDSVSVAAAESNIEHVDAYDAAIDETLDGAG
ncbi:hypothetical protein GGI06_003762, partial [Coemansia sp. S85]